MLQGQPYLLDVAPCLAAFAAFHLLWFTRVVNQAMLTSTDAISIAAAAAPAALSDDVFQDDHGIALGSRVTVAAQIFGPEATEGTLVAATRTHFTLARVDERAGHLHVHFPRLGYVLREVKA